jgi:hypothetical protein
MAKMLIRIASVVPSAAAAGLVVIVTAALTGCGPAGQPGTGHSPARQSSAGQSSAGRAGGKPVVARRFVCADPAVVSAVRVTRLPWLSQIGQSKPLRRTIPRITVRDQAKARALARAVCGLPAMPHGILSCPIDVGGGYQLVFTASGRALHPVTVQASGCEPVAGAGTARGGTVPTRWVARTPGFWATFAQLTGIRAPAHSP